MLTIFEIYDPNNYFNLHNLAVNIKQLKICHHAKYFNLKINYQFWLNISYKEFRLLYLEYISNIPNTNQLNTFF